MQIVFRGDTEFNTFLKELGVEGGDVIKSVNGEEYNVQNVYELIRKSQEWKEGDDFTMTIVRNEEEMQLKAKVSTPMDTQMTLSEVQNADGDKIELRNAWLKG